jgi:hypothetical protein
VLSLYVFVFLFQQHDINNRMRILYPDLSKMHQPRNQQPLLVPGAAEEEQDALDEPAPLARVIAADLLQSAGVDPSDALAEENEGLDLFAAGIPYGEDRSRVDSDTDYDQGEEEEEKEEEASEYEEGESEYDESEDERPVVGRRGLCVLFCTCILYFFFGFVSLTFSLCLVSFFFRFRFHFHF